VQRNRGCGKWLWSKAFGAGVWGGAAVHDKRHARKAMVWAAVFAACSLSVVLQAWHGLDAWALGVLQVGQPAPLGLVSDVLGTYVWGILIVYFLARTRAWQQSPLLPLVAALALAQFVRSVVPLVYFQAPPLRLEAPSVLGPLVALFEQGSYPSGHTARAFAGAAVLVVRTRASPYLWFGVAALAGVTRLLLGVHFVSDVVGGALLGVAAGYAAVALANRLRHRRAG
jgi:membrane-associated phospholipid phosphatase